MIYIRYLQIFRRLEVAYDQVVHPQKRQDIRRALEACMGRALEVRHWMVRAAPKCMGGGYDCTTCGVVLGRWPARPLRERRACARRTPRRPAGSGVGERMASYVGLERSWAAHNCVKRPSPLPQHDERTRALAHLGLNTAAVVTGRSS